MSDRAEETANASMSTTSAPLDLASEVPLGLPWNRRDHGLANANSIALTVIGADLKFILNERGPDAAKREFADIGETAIKFAGIENEGTRQ